MYVHDGVVIWKLAPDLHLFVFSVSSRRKSRQVQTCFFPSLSRLHVLGGAFLAPSPAPFSIVLCHPTPNSRPKEFRLVFASLATAALLDGQPRRRRVFNFVIFSYCLVQILIVCFRLLSSEAIDCYCSWFIVFLLWIQFSAAIATELASKTCVKFFCQLFSIIKCNYQFILGARIFFFFISLNVFILKLS
jgi:hypothetical protein